jgi:hypothetical protein
MKSVRTWLVFAFLLFAMLNWRAISAEPDGYAWNLPKGFPKPYVPAGNPMTAAKVELGRYLLRYLPQTGTRIHGWPRGRPGSHR